MGRLFRTRENASEFSRELGKRMIRSLADEKPNRDGLYAVISPDLPLQIPDRVYESVEDAWADIPWSED